MKSSGIKRGLAALAISGVAVAGIPALAMADTIDTQVSASEGANDVQLYNFDTNLTAKADGTDSTVRLEAGGGENVPAVIFQVERIPFSGIWTDIETVTTRNDDGAFFVEWTPAEDGVFAGDAFRLRAVNAADTGQTDVEGPFILRNASAATTNAINITEGSQKGYFEACFDSGNYSLGVVGTTSVTSTAASQAPELEWMDGSGSPVDNSTDTSNSGDGTFEGVLYFSDGTYDLDDPDLPPAEADEMVVRAVTDATGDDTDDFESFTLYAQTLTSVTATLAPATEPDPGTVTVTVLDQNSQPIAGIDVYAVGGGYVDTTDGRGQIETPQSDTIDYYYANSNTDPTCNTDFSPGAGDKRSNDVNNMAAVVDITTSPSDAPQPVGTTITETIKVTDTNGDPISNRPVRIKRTGPADNGETVFKTTNDAGELTYTFTCNVEGVANLEVGIQGPVAPLADPFTYAIGYDTVNCKNPTPPVKVNLKLNGKSSQGKDIMTANAPNIAAGASVILQKKVNGKWTKIGKTKKLDGAGNRQFGVKDRNGKRVTKYRAIVLANANVLRDVSPVKRQR